jgi:hypothetical protein
MDRSNQEQCVQAFTGSRKKRKSMQKSDRDIQNGFANRMALRNNFTGQPRTLFLFGKLAQAESCVNLRCSSEPKLGAKKRI